MALRLIEIYLPEGEHEEIHKILRDYQASSFWKQKMEEGFLIKVILPAEQTESLLDELEEKYQDTGHFRIVLYPIEAAVPRPKEPDEDQTQKGNAKASLRISREELLSDISDASKLNIIYFVMVLLSTVVAAIGILNNNIPVIIGAMMIAPLLGPNVALSLAVTLGDFDLGMRALKVNFLGIISSLLMTAAIGVIFRGLILRGGNIYELRLGFEDIILALSSGAAGALAFTTAVPVIMVGVMIAVALLPPLVSLGLFLGAGSLPSAWEAFLLLSVNIICVNLAGVAAFNLQGIRPLTWWEEGRAKKARRIAYGTLTVLLILLAVLIFMTKIYSRSPS